jgi:hypothetical protein
MLGLVVDFATNLTFQHGCIDESRARKGYEGLVIDRWTPYL